MHTKSTPDEFQRLCESYGLSLEAGEIERFAEYLSLLETANKRMNLTAIRDPGEAWVRHIFDSLTLMPVIAEIEACRSLADVGSGGGAPGLPLAIAYPEIAVTLIEATGKKAIFLEETARTLRLENVSIVNGRAEDVARDDVHRENYDVVTARAVGSVRVIAELTIPLARVGGLVALVKGAKADEELEDAKGALHRLHSVSAGVVQTPTGRIVVLEKRRKTPRDLPRRPGEPKRNPL
jgi:16S rRNA (guanine527-N7)-methyltransferase